jgi:ankyrin repeat protein
VKSVLRGLLGRMSKWRPESSESSYSQHPVAQICEAVQADAVADVERLLRTYPDTAEGPGFLGGSWLNYASGYGALGVVKHLLAEGADINGRAGSLEQSSLECAALGNRCEVLDYLIDRGARFDMSKSTTNPLFCAMSGDALEALQLLLRHDCDPTVKYDFGKTYNRPEGYWMDVFMRAREWGKLEIAGVIADWTQTHYGYPEFAVQEAEFLAGYPN